MESDNKERSSDDHENIRIQGKDATTNSTVTRGDEQSKHICVFVKIEGTHTSSTETDEIDHIDKEFAQPSTSYEPNENNPNLFYAISHQLDEKDDSTQLVSSKHQHCATQNKNCDVVRSQTVTNLLGKMNENILTIINKFDNFNSDFYIDQSCNDLQSIRSINRSCKPFLNKAEVPVVIHYSGDHLIEKKTETDDFGRQLAQQCTSVPKAEKIDCAIEENVHSSEQDAVFFNFKCVKQLQDIPQSSTSLPIFEPCPCRPSTTESASEVLKYDGTESSGNAYIKTSNGDSEAIFVPISLCAAKDTAITAVAPCERTYHMLHIEAASSPTSSVMYRPPLCERLWSVLTDFFTAVCLCLQVNRDCIFCLGFFVAFVVSASFLTAFFYRTLNIDPQIYQQHQQNQRNFAAGKVEQTRYKHNY